MPTIFRRLVLASALSAAYAAPAHAQAAAFENLDALESRVEAALGAAAGEPGGPIHAIDSRLRLAACPKPVTIEPPLLGAATVRCEPLGWRIRVPISHPADEIVVTGSKPVRKGDQVELQANGGAFTVSVMAIAAEDGALGDRIRVRTDPKAAPLLAEVSGPGRVFLPGFK